MGKTFSTGLLTNGLWQDASNNIGIGGSPSGSYKLEVTGTAKVSSTLLVSGASTLSSTLQVGGTTSSTITIGDAVGSATDSNIRLRTGSTKYAWLIASQNNVAGFEITPSTAVGGTTFSTPALTILPTGAATFSSSLNVNGLATSANYKLGVTGAAFISGSNNKGVFITDGATYASIVGLNSAIATYNGMEIRASGTDGQIFLTTDGNVGIGLTGVYSDVRFMTRGASATSANYSFRSENSSGGNILYLRNDGLFGSGTLALSPFNFDPGGRIMYVNSVGQIGSLSSTRESKININTISNIDYIYKLNPVSFNMRKRDDTTYEYTDEYNEEIRYGFIADEVEKLNEDLVVYNNNDGNKKLSSVDYISFIPVLVKAIQELNEKLIRNNIN